MRFLPTVVLTYDRICEKEPIGRELFRLFCAGDAPLQQAIDFLDEVVSRKSRMFVGTLLCNCMDSLA